MSITYPDGYTTSNFPYSGTIGVFVVGHSPIGVVFTPGNQYRRVIFELPGDPGPLVLPAPEAMET